MNMQFKLSVFSENVIRGNIYLDALELSAFPQFEVTGSEKQTAVFFALVWDHAQLKS